MKAKVISIFILSAVLLILLSIIFSIFSCTSTKQVSRNTSSVDSSATTEQSDSIRLLISEIDRLTTEIKELQYSSVQFDTVYIPGDTVRNTITIKADGSIEAKGNITSAYVSKNLLTKIVNEKQRIIDSLSLVKNKVEIQYKTITKTVEKKSKTKLLGQWWLFPAGFLTAIVLVYRKKISSLIKSTS